MKTKLLSLALTLGLAGLAQAQTYNPIVLTPGSFTQSVIVPFSATSNIFLCNSMTSTMDGGTNTTTSTYYTWYETGYNLAAPSTGLPAAGSTFTSLISYVATNTAPITWGAATTASADTDVDTTGTFLAAYDFDGTAGNGLVINGVTFTGTTTTSGALGTYVSVSGMNGGNYNGYAGSAAPFTGLNANYRKILTAADYASSGSATVTLTSLTPGHMYEVQMWVNDSRSCCDTRMVNVTGGGGNTVLLAFNAIDAANGVGQFSIGTFTANGTTESFTLTGAPSANVGQINALQLRDLGAVGPSVNASFQYQMPSTYVTNNVVLIGSGLTSGTLTLSNETTVTNISILNASGVAAQTVNYAVHHDGGADDTGSFSSPYYLGTAGAAYLANGRISPVSGAYSSVTNGASGPNLYASQIPVSGATPVTGITFSYPGSGSGFAGIFALSGNSSGTNWSPLGVSGYDYDAVVEVTAKQPGAITNYTTATMDNGTVNTANTFYELGFNRNFPTTGLPHAGSTVTSYTHPNRSYTFAASYDNKAPDSILINSTVTTANIVPANPAPYTAFSVLSAGASIGLTSTMTNNIILQHADGTSETNLFLVLDWFSSTTANKAYSSLCRMNVSSNANFDNRVGTNYDELYESTFPMANTTSPVTNIVIKYRSGPATNSTTYIFAVSATAGGFPPVITAVSPASQSWFTGQTATFTATLTGTPPITSLWEVESNGVYVPLSDGTDLNGSVVSGSHTTTLTISGLTLADANNYQYVVTNPVGNATSGPVSLTVQDASLATPVTIVSQIPAASVSTISVFPNQFAEFNVTVNNTASPPISYQWYSGVPQTPANAIPGATNAGYSFSNLTGVTLSCIVSNIAGTATSSPVAISATAKTPLSSPSGYQSALIAYHPVAYWPLNETSGSIAYDLVGNNDGSYVGNCALGQAGVSGAGDLGTNYSVGFDGSTAYVDISVNNLNINGPMTLVQWVQTSGESANTDTGDANLATSVGHGNQSYRLDVDGSGEAHFADSGPDAIGATSVADGNWHQLVGVYDGTNQYLYVDGLLQTTDFVTSPPNGNSSLDVWIGGAPDYGTEASSPGTNRLFYGNICQVAVLTNALSASQVNALYYSASFAPVIKTDLQSSYSVDAGLPLVLPVTVSGTPPLSYQWTSNTVNLVDGGRITGSHSNVLTIVDSQPGDSATYQLTVTNADGSASSVAATVTVVPVLGFNGTGTGWSLNTFITQDGYQNGNNTLQLTSSQSYDATSSFFKTPVYVGGFIATFNYQLTPTANEADGIAFVVQNDSRGAAAVGTDGGSLGYIGISPSIGTEINIYGNQTVGYNIQTNPVAIVTPFLSTAPVDPSSGDLINVTVNYLPGTLTLTLTDNSASTTFSATYPVDIPTLLGTNLAYVGFTGGDGYFNSTQQVSDFAYVPLVSLTAATTSGNNLVLTWPTVIGAYVLEQTSSLASPNWVPATATYSVVGGVNQAIVPVSGAANFYRLHVTY